MFWILVKYSLYFSYFTPVELETVSDTFLSYPIMHLNLFSFVKPLLCVILQLLQCRNVRASVQCSVSVALLLLALSTKPQSCLLKLLKTLCTVFVQSWLFRCGQTKITPAHCCTGHRRMKCVPTCQTAPFFFSSLPTAHSASGKFSDPIILFIPAVKYQ